MGLSDPRVSSWAAVMSLYCWPLVSITQMYWVSTWSRMMAGPGMPPPSPRALARVVFTWVSTSAVNLAVTIITTVTEITRYTAATMAVLINATRIEAPRTRCRASRAVAGELGSQPSARRSPDGDPLFTPRPPPGGIPRP